MAQELEGVDCVLHVKYDEKDIENAKKMFVSIVDNPIVKQGFDKVEKGIGGISQSAEKTYKSIQGLNGITARGFNELTSAVNGLVEKMEELGKKTEESAEKTRKAVTQAVEDSKEEFDGLNALIEKGAEYAGGYLAFDFLNGQLEKIKAVRSEFQSIQYSLQILLGSEEKANAMFEDIKKFAVDTPMDMKGIASSAQLMMGFGIDKDEVMKDLKALGDVAMGDKNRFHSLALAFSQMSAAGKLMGQDLLQMINAGFNPLQQMAITTGKTIGELKEEMSAGMITADMAKQAFWDAAAEGGKYYGMMELQATTIQGQQEKLNDALDALYNTLGEYLEGYIITFIDLEGRLVENWREVAKVIGELVVAYGIYKTVLITHTALSKASAIAERALAKAHIEVTARTRAATTAQVLYNQAVNGMRGALTMLKSMINPWTLLATAIAGATFAIIHYATKESELDKAHKQLNELSAEFATNVQKETTAVDKLFGKLQSLEKGSDKYNQTKRTIINEYGKYLKDLNEEVKTLNDIEGAYKAITQAIRDKWKVQALDKAQTAFNDKTEEKQQEQLKELYGIIDNQGMWSTKQLRFKPKNGVDKARYKETAAKIFNEYVAELDEYARLFDVDKDGETAYKIIEEDVNRKFLGNQKDMKLFARNDMAGNWLEYALKEYYETWKAQRQGLTEAKTMFKTEGPLFEDDDNGNKEDPNTNTTPPSEDPYKKALEDEKKKIKERLNVGKELVSLYNQYKNEVKSVFDTWGVSQDDRMNVAGESKERLNSAVDMLLASNPKFTSADKKTFDDYYAEVSDYSLEKAKQERLKNATRLKELQEQIDNSKAGKFSRKKGSDNSGAINETKESLENLKKIEDEYQKLTIQQMVLQDQIDNGIDLTKFEGKIDAYTQFAKDYTAIIANSRKQMEDLQREYSLASSAEERNKILDRIARVKEENDFQIESLKEQFAMDYSVAVPTEIMEFVGKYMADVTNWTITKINAEILAKKKELNTLRKQAQQTGNDLSAEIAKIEAQIDGLVSAKDEANKKAELDDKPYQKLFKEVSNLTKAFDNLGNAIGGSTGEALKTMSGAVNTSMALAENVVSFTKICKDLIVNTAEEGITALKVLESASVILEIISLVIQLGKTIASVLKDDSLKKFKDEIKELRKEIREFLHELENTKALESNANFFGTDSWGEFSTQIGIANRAMTKYKEITDEIVKNAQTMGGYNDSKISIFGFSNFGDKGTFDTLKGQFTDLGDTIANFKVQVRHKTWLRNEIAYSLKDAVPELFDENGNINKEVLSKFIGTDTFKKLSEENQEYLENMANAWEEYDAAIKSAEDGFTSWMSSVGNQIGDIFVDAFKTGKDAMADFENAWDLAVENMMNSLMYSSFLQPMFDKAQEQIKETGFFEDPTTHITEVLDILGQLYQDTAGQKDNYNKAMQYMRENYGLYDDASTRSALTGGIANVTQDTAEEMNGRLTQIQSHTFAINENVLALRNFGAQQLEILQGIKGDTARLEIIQTEITAVKTSLSDIQIYGIKMK